MNKCRFLVALIAIISLCVFVGDAQAQKVELVGTSHIDSAVVGALQMYNISGAAIGIGDNVALDSRFIQIYSGDSSVFYHQVIKGANLAVDIDSLGVGGTYLNLPCQIGIYHGGAAVATDTVYIYGDVFPRGGGTATSSVIDTVVPIANDSMDVSQYLWKNIDSVDAQLNTCQKMTILAAPLFAIQGGVATSYTIGTAMEAIADSSYGLVQLYGPLTMGVVDGATPADSTATTTVRRGNLLVPAAGGDFSLTAIAAGDSVKVMLNLIRGGAVAAELVFDNNTRARVFKKK